MGVGVRGPTSFYPTHIKGVKENRVFGIFRPYNLMFPVGWFIKYNVVSHETEMIKNVTLNLYTNFLYIKRFFLFF
jgi:hypothetical protein